MHRLTSVDRIVLVAPAVALLLLLAGCTDGTPTAPESSTPPPVVSTPSPTPTPTEPPAVDVTVKPERPAALDEPPSVEGAVAVAEYFVLLYPYVYATGDLAEWRTLSHPECVFCTSVATNTQTMFDRGQRSEGGAFALAETSVLEVNQGAWYTVKNDLVQSPSVTRDANGGIVEEFPETKQIHIDLAVIWDGGAWAIREATPTERPAS